MNCLNPLKRYKEGGAKWLEWNTMLDRCPDLRADMEKATRQEWNGTYPWDEQYRDEYMVEEFSLEQRWEDQILARRTASEVDEAAKAGEV